MQELHTPNTRVLMEVRTNALHFWPQLLQLLQLCVHIHARSQPPVTRSGRSYLIEILLCNTLSTIDDCTQEDIPYGFMEDLKEPDALFFG